MIQLKNIYLHFQVNIFLNETKIANPDKYFPIFAALNFKTMKTMKKIVLLILSVISMFGCDNKTLQDRVIKLEGENDSLKNEIAALNVEIENYKNSPEKLMASAETFYKNRDDVSLNEIRNSLIKYHPECKELEKLTAYIDEVEKQKKKEADEAKLKAEKEAKKLEEQRMAAVGKLKKSMMMYLE